MAEKITGLLEEMVRAAIIETVKTGLVQRRTFMLPSLNVEVSVRCTQKRWPKRPRKNREA